MSTEVRIDPAYALRNHADELRSKTCTASSRFPMSCAVSNGSEMATGFPNCVPDGSNSTASPISLPPIAPTAFAASELSSISTSETVRGRCSDASQASAGNCRPTLNSSNAILVGSDSDGGATARDITTTSPVPRTPSPAPRSVSPAEEPALPESTSRCASMYPTGQWMLTWSPYRCSTRRSKFDISAVAHWNCCTRSRHWYRGHSSGSRPTGGAMSHVSKHVICMALTSCVE
mmetsp:Transcript_1614/g.3319  ORF Transcript_1614/g.3319 Transcript_1614/m.3319 type:complete len:233 (+) Transcript_1614:212-910(+)